MTIETQSTVAAGWYPDPAGTSAQRWWNGVSWTDHLHQPEPVALSSSVPAWTPEQQYAAARERAQQEKREAEYVPFANARQDASPYASAVVHRPAGGEVSNRSAWLSLFLGAVGLTLVLVHLESGQSRIYVTSAAIISIVWGIRALVRRHYGQSTVLWAPIVGMALGVTASILTVLSLTGVMGALHTPNSISPVPTPAASSAAEVGYPSSAPRVFASNDSLTQEEASLGTIVTALENQYNNGQLPTERDGPWPATLVKDAKGAITAPDGTVLASIPASWDFHYTRAATGFQLALRAGDPTEVAFYQTSSTPPFFAVCARTDTTCS